MSTPNHFPVAAPAQMLRAGGTLSDLHTRCIIEFDGKLQIERLSLAVNLLTRAEPLLVSRFVGSRFKPYWQQLPEVTGASIFSTVHVQSPESAINEFLSRSLHPDAGPQMEVQLIRSQADYLCIKVNHMIVDGGGLKNLIALLAEYYHRLKSDPAFLPIAQKRADIFKQAYKHIGVAQVIKSSFHSALPRSDWRVPSSDKAERIPIFEVRHLEPPRVAAIKSYCQQKEVTFSSLLAAAYYHAMVDLLAPANGQILPLAVTTDLRYFLPQEFSRSIGDLAGAYFVILKHDNNTTFAENLAKIEDICQLAKERKTCFSALFTNILFPLGINMGGLILRALIKWRNINNGFFPVISNIGLIDETILDFGDEMVNDVTFYGPTSSRPSNDLTFATFRGKMSITASSNNARGAFWIGKLLDATVKNLP